MRKNRFTEEQIAFALEQAELGTKVEEVCRKLGISEATCYVWKKRYRGTGPSELRTVMTRYTTSPSADTQVLRPHVRTRYCGRSSPGGRLRTGRTGILPARAGPRLDATPIEEPLEGGGEAVLLNGSTLRLPQFPKLQTRLPEFDPRARLTRLNVQPVVLLTESTTVVS